MIAITQYQVIYDLSQQGGGGIRVMLQGQTQWTLLPINNAAEYTVALMILGRSGATYDAATKRLELPQRVPGS